MERLSDVLSEHAEIEKVAHSVQPRYPRLRQAVLRWAFEGRLVDQDPTDEPASVLLEPIRRETSAGGNPTGQKREGRRARRGRIASEETGR